MNYLEIIGKKLIHRQGGKSISIGQYLNLSKVLKQSLLLLQFRYCQKFSPDVDIAETYFTQSIEEIGLPFPNDKTAIYAYLQFYCDEVILGKIESEYAVSELNEICENIKFNPKFKAIYHSAMVVWYELTEDLGMFSMDEPSIYHTEFNHLNIDDYILKKADQFKAVLSFD